MLAFYVMKASEFKQLDLSSDETREIITPYAFKINEALLGLPLAHPHRRGFAMLIDVALIFLAAKLSAAIIAFVAAMAFYKGTAEQYLPTMSGWVRRSLKIIAASFLFVASLSLLSEGIDYFEDSPKPIVSGLNGDINFTAAQKKALEHYLATTEDENCNPECQQQAQETLIKAAPNFEDLVDDETKQLNHFILNMLTHIDTPAVQQATSIAEQSKLAPLTEKINTDKPEANPTKSNQPPYSLIEWAKGILSDLGLGFGWAAVYFTLFPLLWRGQTPGKKLLNIRVVSLSGEYLSLWEAFGRYGGYGAGFATGLLGFLQIYWDPNRQAIQDKISATVVIKGSLKQAIKLDELKHHE
ncbi:hypothetical protein PTUN_a0278 [Pseudoalteromonas tunicata]|jgi:uncharacterized RDD family membrane protein YckC|uniref:RDD domain-containing protein n=2 Tax=Pseudoalteromonas tunicata TaxID=314281 RepID=A4CE59_9GAMM|nr:hypothetical protein PTUN_a0278 [Pseudoalteromonas tunicata]EAR26871.1 hypothetical protein PTD2_09833 [Pseudoalteromonas tunicata D2]